MQRDRGNGKKVLQVEQKKTPITSLVPPSSSLLPSALVGFCPTLKERVLS